MDSFIAKCGILTALPEILTRYIVIKYGDANVWIYHIYAYDATDLPWPLHMHHHRSMFNSETRLTCKERKEFIRFNAFKKLTVISSQINLSYYLYLYMQFHFLNMSKLFFVHIFFLTRLCKLTVIIDDNKKVTVKVPCYTMPHFSKVTKSSIQG